MDIKELRNMIRSSIKKNLRETKQKMTSPKTLTDFRVALSNALSLASAPPDLVKEVADIGGQSSSVFEAVFNAWSDIEAEVRDEKGSKRDALYLEVAPEYVHGMVFDMVDAYQNSYNYEPGRSMKINADSLAAKVSASMFTASKKSPTQT